MSETSNQYILTADTLDIPGVIANVANILLEAKTTVTEAAQYGNDDASRFYLRMAFSDQGHTGALEKISKKLEEMKEKFDIRWSLHNAYTKPKIVLAVSKFGHCLNDLLYRWEAGTLSAEITAVVSNHEDMRQRVEHYRIPFHYLPVTRETKRQQEDKILAIMETSNADTLILARYMQILSKEMCVALEGRAINIHHSFLPSFKGGRPYHQAFERGVKIIGATAHYVTADLDEGPIIEQDVQRVEHFHNAAALVRRGSDVESQVLARAVNWHCEHRILMDGHKTIIFK
jgi:formyltetrahydrofolate deformylase